MFHDYFFPVLFAIILTGLLYTAGVLLMKYYFSHKKSPGQPQTADEDQKIILPLRLQAYERIVLFLERITPSNLIMRINQNEMTAVELQTALVKTIREDFEYNLSQQVYLSPRSWELIKHAKEECIKMINLASGKVSGAAPSAELVRIIFNLVLEQEKLPVAVALEEIKAEIQRSF